MNIRNAERMVALAAVLVWAGLAWGGAATQPASRPASPPASRPATQPAADKPTELVNEIVRAYLQGKEALAKDDLAGAKRPMSRVFQSANALFEHRSGLAPLLSDIGGQAARANDSQDLAGFREAFGRLSPAVIELVKRIRPGEAVAGSLYEAYCPMVKKSWLQAGKEIHNPYGPNMASCGTLKSDNLIGPVRPK